MKSKCERELEDARYEAERLRDQLEAKERREAREQREREEQRKRERRERDPSSRLYNGDVSTDTIITEFQPKPIPTTRFDWVAWREDHEDQCGYGATEREAIESLRDR